MKSRRVVPRTFARDLPARWAYGRVSLPRLTRRRGVRRGVVPTRQQGRGGDEVAQAERLSEFRRSAIPGDDREQGVGMMDRAVATQERAR